MKTITEETIAEMVREDYRTAKIFKKYNIDFCCKGNISLEAICLEKNIDTEKIRAELTALQKSKQNRDIDYNSWHLDLLANYIEKKHHRYVEETTPTLKSFLDKICSVHGNKHPELFQINKLFHESAGEFAVHMKKEELIIFPFIRKMVAAETAKKGMEKPSFGSIEDPIEMMKHDHVVEGERFEKIAALSNNYTPPADACNTYKVTFALLKEFEEDLHLHVHLENNILFPKAIELEKKFDHG
ncbi:MAG: iron-sulfur cluster repair di-iron protein [Bacteroidia bacterium]